MYERGFELVGTIYGCTPILNKRLNTSVCIDACTAGGVWFGLVYWGLTPQQQPGSYQGGEMMKSVFWWRKPEYPEETTDLQQVTDETFHTYGLYQGGEMLMKSVFWWRKPEYPEETTDLRQVTDETFHTYGLCPVRGLNLGHSSVKQSELRRSSSRRGIL